MQVCPVALLHTFEMRFETIGVVVQLQRRKYIRFAAFAGFFYRIGIAVIQAAIGIAEMGFQKCLVNNLHIHKQAIIFAIDGDFGIVGGGSRHVLPGNFVADYFAHHTGIAQCARQVEVCVAGIIL